MVKRLFIAAFFGIILLFAGCDQFFFEDSSEKADFLDVYDAFYEETDQYFSFFAYLDADFDSAYQVNRVRLQEDPTREQLLEGFNELLGILKDGHTNIFFSRSVVLSYDGWYTQYPVNTIPDMQHYFSSYNSMNPALEYGEVANTNMGYIRIKTFSRNLATSNYQAIDQILTDLSEKDAIIIDVRSNGGGSSRNSDLISSRFNDQVRVAFRSRRKLPGPRDRFEEWSDIHTLVYEGNRFLKPVAVLTNRRCYSSTEWFLTGMRTMPHVRLIGDTTGGGSGNPLARILPDGWTMRVSNSQKELPEGLEFQYDGIYPDTPIWISESDSLNGIDTILEEAINQLSMVTQ